MILVVLLMLSSELRFQRSQGHYNSLTANHNVPWKTEMWNKKVTLLNVLHLEIKVKNGSDGSFNQGSNGLLLSFCTGQTFYSFKYRCHVLYNWLWPVTSQMSCIICNCSSTYVFFFFFLTWYFPLHSSAEATVGPCVSVWSTALLMSVILGANGIFDLSQVRSGSRALYRPLSASVLSRPDVSSAEVSGLFFFAGV